LDTLGNPGSNPLELFWDVVDELDQALDASIEIVEKAFKDKGFTMTVDTREEDLLKFLQEVEQDWEDVKPLTEDERREIWKAVSIMHLFAQYSR
jgi:pre-mRNA-processing factor 40